MSHSTQSHFTHLRQAIALSTRSIAAGGGPFGAVIVRAGQSIAAEHNRVTLDHDPTAHAEVLAIRAACRKLGSHELTGCVLYSSCEPCPMCLSAAYWARIDTVYYGASREDAASVGFSDAHIYEELRRSTDERQLALHRLLPDEAAQALAAWSQVEESRHY